jgi:hypothetical protein
MDFVGDNVFHVGRGGNVKNNVSIIGIFNTSGIFITRAEAADVDVEKNGSNN